MMTSKKLQMARDYEDQYGPSVTEAERPEYHVTGAIGWINDPNGFCLYKDEYHLFFQYHPYSTLWGPMHWGHVKTRDFIRWERMPIALAPDMPYDQDGCFSGSAIELPDGSQLLMYTGMLVKYRKDGTRSPCQTQCLAVGDGMNYEKIEGNPVLTAMDLPSGCSEADFRDPKIWKEIDGYYAVVGNRSSDDSGSILLFQSTDAFHWKYLCHLATNRNRYGKMWECPDFFHLSGRDVLLVSAQEMSPVGLEFPEGPGTICMVGKIDENRQLIPETIHAVDYGIDFYAPQTLLAPDGRRIMIAWMQNWDTARIQPQGIHICGQMTLPRELSLRNGRLIQQPVHELSDYYGGKISYRDVPLSAETILEGVHGRVIDLTINVRPSESSMMYRRFKLSLAGNGEYVTTVSFMPERGIVCVDRSRCGFPFDIMHVREIPVRSHNGIIKLRTVLDRYSLELFINDGEQAASFTLCTPFHADAIRFEADGEVLMDVDKYDLVFDQKE